MKNCHCGKDWRGVGAGRLLTCTPLIVLFLLRTPTTQFVTATDGESGKVQLCELPDCSIVRRSRLHSDRCGTAPAGWPLLVTATPRSATVYMNTMLNRHGAVVHNDWGNPSRDGTVSWIMAFDDRNNFGPARTQGRRFERVLHQLHDPLKGITSMCTESLFRNDYLPFLLRHINVTAADESPRFASRGVLQFWVEWHSFLREARFPSYQVEETEIRTIFRMGGLSESFFEPRRRMQKNHREHRPYFSWRELFTIDPEYAARAWEMAHHYGYRYPNVTFEQLTCLDVMPECAHDGSKRSRNFIPNAIPPNCPPGSHPPVTVRTPSEEEWIDPIVGVNGVKGWVDTGCVERRLSNGTYVGLTGVFGQDEDDPIEGSAVTDEWIETLLLPQYQKQDEGRGQGKGQEKSFGSDSTSSPQADEFQLGEITEEDGGVNNPNQTIVEEKHVNGTNGAIHKGENLKIPTDVHVNKKAAGIAALFLGFSLICIGSCGAIDNKDIKCDNTSHERRSRWQNMLQILSATAASCALLGIVGSSQTKDVDWVLKFAGGEKNNASDDIAYFDWRATGSGGRGGSSVDAQPGMTLGDIVVALKAKNSSICVVHEGRTGFGGLSNGFKYRLPALRWAVSNVPYIKWMFGRIEWSGGNARAHNNSQFMNIFKEPEGRGCKRNGEDGRKMPARFCLKNAANGSLDIGDMELQGFHTIQDGDTLTVCVGRLLMKGPSELFFDYRPPVRNALMQVYWTNSPRVASKKARGLIAEARTAGEIAIAVHFRNGDVQGASENEIDAVRYVHAGAYYSLGSVVAGLRPGCARMHILSEIGDDPEVLHFESWFRNQSHGNTPLTILDKKTCGARMILENIMLGQHLARQLERERERRSWRETVFH